MNLCDRGHDEICFEGKKCPACEKIDELCKEIKGLEKDLESAKEELDSAQSEIASLTAIINEPLSLTMHQVSTTHDPN